MRRDGIEYYRWQASHCRELAERQTKAEVKAQLLKVALEYEQLAKDANEGGNVGGAIGPMPLTASLVGQDDGDVSDQ